MLYKFKSKDYGDVIMLELNGRRVLEIIGKDAGSKGIILPGQMPAAIAALQAAIVEEERAEKEAGVAQGDGPGLRQRALPFIELLQRNHQAGHEVVWGV
jgi:hypothetical protein